MDPSNKRVKSTIDALINVITERHGHLQGFDAVALFIRNIVLKETFPDAQNPQSNDESTTAQEIVSNLQKRDELVRLFYYTLSVASKGPDEHSAKLASRILAQIKRDTKEQGAASMPASYIIPSEDGVAVALVVDYTYWTDPW